MPKRKLTQNFVETVRPRDRAELYWHSERVQRGVRLGLKVTPSGKRVFVVQYRPVGGRRDTTRRVTLAATDLLAAEREARELFRRHHDPAHARQEARQAETVAEAMPQFLAELAGKKKPSTVYEWTRILGGDHNGVAHPGYVLEALGTSRVRDVTPAAIATLHRRISNSGSTRRPIMANRVLGALSAFFAWCERHGLRPRGENPARLVEKFPERTTERFLDEDEIRRLGEALHAAETVGLRTATRLRKTTENPEKLKHRPASADLPRKADPVAVAAIRFLMFSGFREQEALSLRWDSVDFARAIVTLDDSKTGRSVRYVGSAALDVLQQLPRTTEHVFPGAVIGQPRKEIKRTWYAVREEAKLEDVRLHDLRHTVASVAASRGESLPQIAALLGHRDTKSTVRYAHLIERSMREMADRVNNDIRSALRSASVTAPPGDGAAER